MRGLEARLRLARHRISAAVGLDDAGEHLTFATEAALLDGYDDARQGVTEMPAFFRDEPELQKAWKTGRDGYWLMRETADCWHCQEHRGIPCPNHG